MHAYMEIGIKVRMRRYYLWK